MQETQLTRKKTILNATPTITHHLPEMPGKFEVATGPCIQISGIHIDIPVFSCLSGGQAGSPYLPPKVPELILLELHFLTHQKYSVQKTVLYADYQERIRHARCLLTSGMAGTKAAAADRTGHQHA